MTATAELMPVQVEVRAVDDAQRLATMLVCRYGETSRLTPRPERFTRGAFTRSVTERGHKVPFTDRHTDGTGVLKAPAVARPVSWDTSGTDELLAVLRFYDTPEGWAAFYRARDKEINGGSVGFRPVTERTAGDGVREITEAALHHVCLLDRQETPPAYDAPRLLEVRTAPEVAALLAVKWDPALAEHGPLADELARIGGQQ